MKKIALCFFALCTVVILSACNTVGGFGQDVKNVGQSIDNASKK